MKNNIIFLFSQFPAWTDCLRSFYKSPLEAATSARSEEYFKDEKTNSYIQHPINPNKFILSHLKTIQGRVKLAKAAIKNKNLEKLKVTPKSIRYNKKSTNKRKNCADPKVGEIKIRNKNNLRTPRNEFYKMEEEQPNINKNDKIKLANFPLRNGLCLPPILYGGNQSIKFINTCAFDCITEMFVQAYKSNASVQQFVNYAQMSNYLQFIYNYANHNIDLAEIYHQRAKLLYPFNRVTAEPDERDCSINITELTENMLRDNSNSLISCKKFCTKCGFQNTETHFNTFMLPFRVIPKLLEGENGCQNLQECINEIFLTPEIFICKVCHEKSLQRNYTVQDIFIIETEFIFTNSDLKKTINSQCPINIIINNNVFEIIGLAEIVHCSETTNHYIAHCFVNGQWEKRDGLSDQVYIYTNQPTTTKISMLLYAKK